MSSNKNYLFVLGTKYFKNFICSLVSPSILMGKNKNLIFVLFRWFSELISWYLRRLSMNYFLIGIYRLVFVHKNGKLSQKSWELILRTFILQASCEDHITETQCKFTDISNCCPTRRPCAWPWSGTWRCACRCGRAPSARTAAPAPTSPSSSSSPRSTTCPGMK